MSGLVVEAGNGLTIPPYGAMQFEVTNDWNGKEVPVNRRPFVFWVMAKPVPIVTKQFKPDCPHSHGYVALKATLPSGAGKVGMVVCPCVGHLIE